MKNFKIALSSADAANESSPILLTGSICENLKTAGTIGYDAIEIHLRENDDIRYEDIIKTGEQNKVKIASIVTGRLAVQRKISLTDASERNASIAYKGVLKYIDIAARFNTDIIIGWIRGKRLTQSRDAYEALLAEKIKKLETYAQAKNVRVFVEAINRYEINTMNTAEEIMHWIEKYKLVNTYVHLDTFHMNIEEADISKAIELCGKKLGYIHFADSNRYYPGAGHIDFESILKSLDKIEYDGYLSVECLPFPERTIAASKALKTLKNIIDQ
jgi:sugar phosphate isomerase/epimerase